jgi:hypothetical protein
LARSGYKANSILATEYAEFSEKNLMGLCDYAHDISHSPWPVSAFTADDIINIEKFVVFSRIEWTLYET